VAGKFVIRKSGAGKYDFVLKADNGEIIATSESYTTKAAAKNGFESVRETPQRDSRRRDWRVRPALTPAG
jgi:uncharacterized protein YegP (UPF0339 family)